MRGKKAEINLGYLLGFFSILLLLFGSGLVMYGYYKSDYYGLMATGGIATAFGFAFLITAIKIA